MNKTIKLTFTPLVISFYFLLAVGTKGYSQEEDLIVDRIANRLNLPWSISFLDTCQFLVTEKNGNLYHYDQNGDRTSIEHTLKVSPGGQGGLLDVVAARDFETSRTIFLTYSISIERGNRALGVSSATLSENYSELQNQKTLFVAGTGDNSTYHFGSRVVESQDGKLFITHGDRGTREAAQSLNEYNGKIFRINPDGTIPTDNPFFGRSDALPEIWSYGHRNPQGAALDLNGNLLASEHGARGGDEMNVIRKGLNYGWPVISYGVHYTGAKIGVGTKFEGMEQPKHYWDPSIAPSGTMVYSGKLWPEWTGHVFVGSLKFDYIAILDPKNGWQETDRIKIPETRRVRDVRENPDGTIWFLAEERNALYRLSTSGFRSSCNY